MKVITLPRFLDWFSGTNAPVLQKVALGAHSLAAIATVNVRYWG